MGYGDGLLKIFPLLGTLPSKTIKYCFARGKVRVGVFKNFPSPRDSAEQNN